MEQKEIVRQIAENKKKINTGIEELRAINERLTKEVEESKIKYAKFLN